MPAYAPNDPIILPDDAMRDLTSTSTPNTPSEPLASLGNYQGLLAINRVLKDDLGLGGRLIGSNNWVLGGARTTTGKPLLANDPHLGAQIPSIDTRTITTQVLVNDGQTVVLGGILETERRETEKKVPYLGDVPVLGRLFKTTGRTNNKDELLIFVTPKILREGVNVY